jgi:hypothetical protein
MWQGRWGTEVCRCFREPPKQSAAPAWDVACNQIYLAKQRKNANNAKAAALMMSAQIHPVLACPVN